MIAVLVLFGSTVACSVSTPPVSSTSSAVLPTTAAATSAAAPTGVPTASPTQPQAPSTKPSIPSTGLIGYVGSDGNIYTVDSLGKQHSAVTTDALLNPPSGQAGRIYQYPTWSPDSQSLAFMRFTSDSPTSGQSSLMASSVDGKQQVEAFASADTAPFYLFWSPDSQKITFLTNDATGGLALYMSAAAGGNSQVISTGSPYYWDWSPDNKTLIIHTGGDAASNPDARLALVQMDGTVVKNELDLKPGTFQAPAWSPSGDAMVLTTQDASGSQSLVLAGRDGKVTQTLAQPDGQVAFAWSPQGGSLAYSNLTLTNGGVSGSLTLLDTAHPDQKKEIGRGDLMAFFWSPDGSKIAYFAVTGSGSQASIRPVAQATAPRVTLDVYVYDLSSGQARQVATFAPTDSFNQVLPYFDQYQRSGTLWSPDSRNLVLAGVEAGGTDAIYVVDVAGGPLRKIAAGEVAFWSWK